MIVEKRADGKVETEATIKVWLEGERYVRTAEGNGPVNALDAALRAAIAEIYPHLRDIELVNYKVRILDEAKGTGAITRVLIDASDGDEVWGSIGVGENVIAASWEALVDSLEYGDAAGRSRRRGGRAHGPVRASRSRSPGPCWARPEEQAVLEVLRSGHLSLGPRVPEFEAAFAARLGVAARERRLVAAPPACTSRCARSAWPTATRSSRRRSRSSPRPTPRSTSAPGRCSPTSTR